MIREQIEAKLRAAFDPVYLEVVDESYRHNVPAGSESHFKVVLVSDRFLGERFLNRHRMIYGTLTEELSSTVHALALHTYTIKEWGRATGYRLCFSSLSRGWKYRVEIAFATAGAFPVCCVKIYEKTACGPFCFA
ncbi:cell division protein BolA [Klebsiella michiganensis]|nr:cell division protein BolA [Klebsiella michiganensis]